MGKGHLLNTTYLNGGAWGAFAQQPSVAAARPTGASVWPANDAFNFDIDETGRGIILTNPMTISGTSITLESGALDPSELRRALLFWDLIAWPSSNNFYIASGPDVEFLIAEKRLVRPFFGIKGHAAMGLSMAFVETLNALEQKRPGQWMMSSGGRALALNGKEIINDRGVLTTLSNLIPVPMHDMPLEDVLEFKDKRLPEVMALRSVLDGFYQDWVNSEDPEHQLRMAINALDMASADMIKVAQESRNPFALSSWEMSFSFAPINAIQGFLGGTIFGLDTASSVLMGAASTISLSKGVGLKTAKRNSPFSYIASIHSELR